MEWAEDSRETGATAIAIAICSFSPPPSSFQQLNLSFCNQQPDCFQAKQNPTPLHIYIFNPKNSLRRNRGSRDNNTTTAAAISTTVAASKSLSFFPFIEFGVGNNFNYLSHWNSQPRKGNSINQSIDRCLFPGFCKLRWFVYEDRLATVEKNCLWCNAISPSVLSSCLYCGVLLMFGIKWFSRG
jgi:hypothetical protein